MATVRFNLGENTPTTLFQSKIGGKPYMPIGVEYPMHTKKGRPLLLLAQINFAEMPPLENFPTKGILQFFIDGLDGDFFGIDFDDVWKQDGFRVIYYPEILPESQLQTDFSAYKVDVPYSEYGFNLLGEYPIIYKEIETEDDCNDYYNERNIFNKIGGVPCFVQGDPFANPYIDDDGNFCKSNVSAWSFEMLLQIGGNEQGILWGGYNSANFFIKPKNLKNLDFSEVAFCWAGG